MLNIFDNSKTYYDNFSYYLDRNKNLNVIFSFNFYKFILDNVPGSSQTFALENKNNYQIKVFLTKEEEYKNYIELFDVYQKTDILSAGSFIDTYFCKKSVTNLNGKYKVLVRISYGSLKQKFIEYEMLSALVFDGAKYNNLKYEEIINETKYAFFDKKSNNLENQHTFISEEIEIDFNKKYIYNLYDVYSDNISYTNLSNYLSSLESRGINFENYIPTNAFFNESIKKLDFNFLNNSGNKINYFDLISKIFRLSNDQKNYKDINYINNIFIEEMKTRKNRKTSIKSYEKMIDSLTSTSCENNIIDMPIDTDTSIESDVLVLSFFYDNIYNLGIDKFWENDITLLPIYILDIKSKYKMHYLEKIDADSMTQNWKMLDKQTLENLNNGNYLCKIVTDELYLTDLLMENYFILNK